MKAVLVLLFAAAVSALSLEEFRAWAELYGKVYTLAEEARRFAIFKENSAIAERLNLEDHGAFFGSNQFSDLTSDEFRRLYTTNLRVEQQGQFDVVPDYNADDLDYKDYLPAIKNQGQCGSCWAFSAVQNAEGQTYMNNGGKVVSLSEQQLVSCDKTNMACNGGSMILADMYIVRTGLASESAYPYKSGSGSVPACKSFSVVAEFSSYKSLGKVSNDNTLIKHLEEYGPLSVAIEADKSVFQNYVSGVLDSTSCGTNLNHGVGLVGYGTDSSSGKPYWTVRNSWGTAWGEKGYGRLVRGKNMCGINSQVSTIIA
jgi:hypothetical protein